MGFRPILLLDGTLMEEVLGTGGIVGHPDPAAFIAGDGAERIMTYNSAPTQEKNGDIIGVILALRDVTEKQEVEEELLRSRKLESLGILAGGFAHDFNNFLTAILGNQQLDDQCLPGHAKRGSGKTGGR